MGLYVRLAGLFASLAGFWVFGNEICQTIGPIVLGVGKQQDLRNKFCQTVEDALCLFLKSTLWTMTRLFKIIAFTLLIKTFFDNLQFYYGF